MDADQSMFVDNIMDMKAEVTRVVFKVDDMDPTPDGTYDANASANFSNQLNLPKKSVDGSIKHKLLLRLKTNSLNRNSSVQNTRQSEMSVKQDSID